MSIAGANIETCGGTFVQMQNDGDPDAEQAGKGFRDIVRGPMSSSVGNKATGRDVAMPTSRMLQFLSRTMRCCLHYA